MLLVKKDAAFNKAFSKNIVEFLQIFVENILDIFF